MFRKHRLENWRGLTYCNVSHTPIQPQGEIFVVKEEKPRVPGERLLMQLNKQRKKEKKKRISMKRSEQIEKSIQEIINSF